MASSKDKSQAANEIAGSKRLLEAVFKSKTPPFRPEDPKADSRTASEVMATQGILDARPHSTDIWSAAQALDVLREESYNFGGAPVICTVLADAAQYLREFGGIQARKENDYRLDASNRVRDAARESVYETDAYREGERILRLREARKFRTETRKTEKVVERG